MQDAGCRMQDAGCRMQDAGCLIMCTYPKQKKYVFIDQFLWYTSNGENLRIFNWLTLKN
jgi:hypothetical protein